MSSSTKFNRDRKLFFKFKQDQEMYIALIKRTSFACLQLSQTLENRELSLTIKVNTVNNKFLREQFNLESQQWRCLRIHARFI
jgi:hypothetical protein